MNLRQSSKRPMSRVGSGLIKAGLIVCLCIALACAGWILDRASMRIQLFTYGWSYGFWVNAVPIVVLFMLLLALFNRVALAGLVTLALVFALYVVNYLKLKYLAVPVSFGDVYLLQNVHLATLRLLADYVNPGLLIPVLLVAAAFFRDQPVHWGAVAGARVWCEKIGCGSVCAGFDDPACGVDQFACL